jgi:hypothetical protein
LSDELAECGRGGGNVRELPNRVAESHPLLLFQS